jgi:hypothetical protein
MQSITFQPTIIVDVGTVVGGGDDVAQAIAQAVAPAVRDEFVRTQQQIGIHGKLFAI